MSIYNGMSGKETNLEQSYMLLDLAGQVAHGVSAIGLVATHSSFLMSNSRLASVRAPYLRACCPKIQGLHLNTGIFLFRF